MSALSATSPRAWSMSLPISSVTGRANSSTRARIIAAAFPTTTARSANVVCRHVSKQVAAVLSAVSSCSSVSCSNVFKILPSIWVDALVGHGFDLF